MVYEQGFTPFDYGMIVGAKKNETLYLQGGNCSIFFSGNSILGKQ